jgi:hypothetical protein
MAYRKPPLPKPEEAHDLLEMLGHRFDFEKKKPRFSFEIIGGCPSSAAMALPESVRNEFLITTASTLLKLAYGIELQPQLYRGAEWKTIEAHKASPRKFGIDTRNGLGLTSNYYRRGILMFIEEWRSPRGPLEGGEIWIWFDRKEPTK